MARKHVSEITPAELQEVVQEAADAAVQQSLVDSSPVMGVDDDGQLAMYLPDGTVEPVSEIPVKRQKIIKIRVSDAEHETLKWLSTKAQLAEWMRDTCLNAGQTDLVTASKGPEPVDPQLLRQLAGIGNNLNQIARRVNAADWGPSDRVQVISALASVESALKSLRELYR